MGITDYHIILDLFITFYGLTGSLACLNMYRTHTLSPSRLIIPNSLAPEDCVDPEGYLRCILPRAAVFSLLNLVCGGVNLLCAFFPDCFPPVLLNVTIPVFLVNLLLFGHTLSKTAKHYW